MSSKVEQLAERLAGVWLREMGVKLDRMEMEMMGVPASWDEFAEERKDLFRKFAKEALKK